MPQEHRAKQMMLHGALAQARVQLNVTGAVGQLLAHGLIWHWEVLGPMAALRVREGFGVVLGRL